jgi:DHA2 family metal-tetracycline-proton antiporter-like MFS transporter
MNPANHSAKSSPQWLILLLISLASFMGALDTTIVNISLPSISKYFHSDVATVSWVAIAYLLILSSTLITFGRVADIRGYKKIYIAGFAIFTIGSLSCGLSSTIYLLIGFRVLQGAGAAMLQAIGGAMVVRYLPEKIRGTAFGILTTSAAVGLAAGTPLGGFLSQFYSWHWIFFVNIPVGIVAIILAVAILPRDSGEFAKGRFDLPGASLLLVALVSFIFFLNMGTNIGWLSWVILGSIAVSAAAWAGFIFNEKRAKSPLINLSFFRDRNFAMAVVVALLILLMGQGSWYAFPFYLELEKGFAANIAGLILLVPTILMMVCGPIAGFLSDRIGPRRICILGSAVLIVAFVIFAVMGTRTGLQYIIIALAIEGVGIGLVMPANFNLIMCMSTKGDEGVISSLVNTVRNVGAVMGIAVFTLIFLSVIAGQGISPANIAAHSLPPKAFVFGFHAIFLFGAAVGGVLLALNLALRDKKKAPDSR